MAFTPQSSTSLSLAKRGMYIVPDTSQRITCRTGTLWITQADDPSDIILEPGESFVTDGHQNVIAYALSPATFTVTTHPAGGGPVQRASLVHRRHGSPALALE